MTLKFSIIVPSFNQGPFIAQALDSILGQDHRPLEVLVMDGGSTDQTVDVLREYAARWPELRWWSERDKGPADAVNKGLAQELGDWVGVCSSDDLYLPGALKAVAATATAHPDCGFIYGDVQAIDAKGTPGGRSNFPEFDWAALFGTAMCIHQGSIFFKSSVAREVGGWNADYYGCDLDYWMRLMFRTHARKLTRPLSAWRVYPEQRTRPDRYARICRDYARMIEDSPDVRAAPWRVRRMAMASRHIMPLMYPPSDDLAAKRRHWLAALWGHPTFWRYHARAFSLSLLPGYPQLRKAFRTLVPLRAGSAQP